MPRVLLIAATTGYQTRAFGEAAERLGVELVFATDRCHQLDDPWRDGAIPVSFHDDAAFLEAIGEAARHRPVHGVLAVGDRPAVFAALACEALGLPGHPPAAARASGNKLETRRRFAAAGLPGPAFCEVMLDSALDAVRPGFEFPCVVKPLALSGSRGVIRADDPGTLHAALERVQRLLSRADIRERRYPSDDRVVLEAFIPGREYAVEGVVEDGTLRVLAVFDKPNPLDGPFFEESIYVTPSAQSAAEQRRMEQAVADAVGALGLRHGPVHAECRVNEVGVFVLEVAARPIGGLCAQALRFQGPGSVVLPLEELLLRHALGEPLSGYRRETDASAVMMIPDPTRRGLSPHRRGRRGASGARHRRRGDDGQAGSAARAAPGRGQLSRFHLRAVRTPCRGGDGTTRGVRPTQDRHRHTDPGGVTPCYFCCSGT